MVLLLCYTFARNVGSGGEMLIYVPRNKKFRENMRHKCVDITGKGALKTLDIELNFFNCNGIYLYINKLRN